MESCVYGQPHNTVKYISSWLYIKSSIEGPFLNILLSFIPVLIKMQNSFLKKNATLHVRNIRSAWDFVCIAYYQVSKLLGNLL